MRIRRIVALVLCPLLLGGLILSGCTQAQRGPVQVAGAQTPQQQAATPATAMPNRAGSLKFAVLGDFGDGSGGQMAVAAEMARVHARYPFEFVITVGDNIYGSERPQDLVRKFEDPYKPLLDKDMKFYASLGNHDSPEQRYYKLFNMDGKLYYSFIKQNVKFIALQSDYLEPEQMAWLEKELAGSREDWKIPYFHHPPYSSGGRHGSHLRHREALEPLFVKYNVSTVFTGHDHIYERIKPQQGIVYFVTGSGGKLRAGGIESNTGITAASNAKERVFVICEVIGDELYFNAISQTGKVIDSGVITRRK
ncbi:MAG: metallophosphoesterase [Acidobacteria bacterium]|nr:metallophosphoesterase [Acidobacteriota bacterium]